MTNVFLTRVWGYTPATWPILPFGQQGGANKLNREYRTGDWVVLMGTNGPPTAPENYGRLLGLVQVTNMVVDVQEELESLGTELGQNCFVNGHFKWPRGFPFLKAFSITGKPLLTDILPERGNNLARAEAAYAMKLAPEEADAILALDTREDDFPLSPTLAQQQNLNQLLTKPGPVPAMGERTSTYSDGDNSVYLFRLEGTNWYKIGRTNDIDRRLREFNRSPQAVWSGKQCELINKHTFPFADDAHEVEQMIHKHLKQYARPHECFEVPRENVVTTALASMIYEYSLKKKLSE